MPRRHTITIQDYHPDDPIPLVDLGRRGTMRRFGRTSYQQIARAMQEAHGTEPISLTAEAMWRRSCQALCNIFHRDSQYFKPDRFIAACQPGANAEEHLRQIL